MLHFFVVATMAVFLAGSSTCPTTSSTAPQPDDNTTQQRDAQ